MKKQREIVSNLTDKELLLNVYYTQAIIFLISAGLAFFVFDSWKELGLLFSPLRIEFIFLAAGSAVFVVLIDILLEKRLPSDWLDDGGINERVFRTLSLPQLVFICLTVALTEELLFRAVLQTSFGIVVASLIFALIHFRYLDKPILFINVVCVSFLLGGLFWWSGNILVSILAHFLIDLILGFIIRQRHIQGEGEGIG